MDANNSPWYSPRNWPLTLKLTAAMMILVILTVSWVTWFSLHVARSRLATQVGGTFQTQALTVADLIFLAVASEIEQLQAAAQNTALIQAVQVQNRSYTGSREEIVAQIRERDRQWATATEDHPLVAHSIQRDPQANPAAYALLSFLESFPAHSEIFATDRYGATVGATERLSDYDQSDEDWWQKAWNEGRGAVFLSEPRFDDSARVNAFLIAVPIYDRAGGVPVGILRSTLRVDEIFRHLDSLSEGKCGVAELQDREGRILHAAASRRSQDALGPAALSQEQRRSLTAGTPGYRLLSSAQGQEAIVGYAGLQPLLLRKSQGTSGDDMVMDALRGLGWTVVVQQPTVLAFTSLDEIVQACHIAGAVAVLLGGLMAFFLARAITRPLVGIQEVARQIAAGKLDASVPATSSDEIGRLAASVNEMTANLRRQSQEITDGVTVLAKSTEEVLAAAKEFAAGATQTAAAVTETMATADELRHTAETSSAGARHVAENAQQTVAISQRGIAAVAEQVQGMESIRRQMGGIAASIQRLKEQGQAIGDIMATVKDLAEQANILSINAAIEAAKAGEYGKGFAVVAHEIALLAEQSKEATIQVGSILKDINAATDATVAAVQTGSDTVDRGVDTSGQAGESIQLLADNISGSVSDVENISASAEQQLAAIEQVVDAIAKIGDASRHNEERAMMLTGEAQRLNELGQKLRRLVSDYYEE